MIPPITVHLLDSAQGHPLQTWTFDSHEALTMGRSPDNDIVVADPYVSRAHAYLKFDGGQWRLIAISRQQLVSRGTDVPEIAVDDGTVCRLGPHGCYLRFGNVEIDIKATIAPDVTLMPVLQARPRKVAAGGQPDHGWALFSDS